MHVFVYLNFFSDIFVADPDAFFTLTDNFGNMLPINLNQRSH